MTDFVTSPQIEVKINNNIKYTCSKPPPTVNYTMMWMFHPINFKFGKNLWVRSYRTRRRKRWPNTLVSPASKGWAYDQPTSKPISLHFPNTSHSYILVKKNMYIIPGLLLSQKKWNIFAWCPCTMNQLARCQNFQKPISTTFPALSLRIHNLCKMIRNNFKNPIIWTEIPLARHQSQPLNPSQRHTSISPPQSSEIRAGNWPPKPAGCRRPWWWKAIPNWLGTKNSKRNTWLGSQDAITTTRMTLHFRVYRDSGLFIVVNSQYKHSFFEYSRFRLAMMNKFQTL